MFLLLVLLPVTPSFPLRGINTALSYLKMHGSVQSELVVLSHFLEILCCHEETLYLPSCSFQLKDAASARVTRFPLNGSSLKRFRPKVK